MAPVSYKVAEDEVRPAMVVCVFSPDCVNLQVFVDGINDRKHFTEIECERGLAWRTSVQKGDAVGQWHPPKEVNL